MLDVSTPHSHDCGGLSRYDAEMVRHMERFADECDAIDSDMEPEEEAEGEQAGEAAAAAEDKPQSERA